AGVLALAWLPGARVAWTIPPQLLAGAGMGLALPAIAGELLPERTALEASRSLAVRHAGMTLVLLALAPVIAHSLQTRTELAGGLAVLAAAALALGGVGRVALLSGVALAVAVPAAYAAADHSLGPKPVPIRNPCGPRSLPGTGGIGGFLQDRLLELLDGAAC